MENLENSAEVNWGLLSDTDTSGHQNKLNSCLNFSAVHTSCSELWAFGGSINNHQELFPLCETGKIHVHLWPWLCRSSPTFHFCLSRSFRGLSTCRKFRNIFFDLNINIWPVDVSTCKCFHPCYPCVQHAVLTSPYNVSSWV